MILSKKTVYDKLIAKVNLFDSRLVLKTQYNTDKLGIEKKSTMHLLLLA